MRITRHKAFKKALRFYKAAFDFVDPFHVILDPTFLDSAVVEKLDLKSDLSSYLSGRVTPMVTSCVMCHLRKNGRTKTEALMMGKSCFRLKCGHDESKPLSAADCIISQLGKENQRHFLIASQDDSLKSQARRVPGTPVITVNGRLLILEAPSDESRAVAQHREEKRRLPMLSEIVESESSDSDSEEAKSGKKKRKRRQKGANPLSCRPKRIKLPPSTDEPVGEKPKRVRSKRVSKSSSFENPAVSDTPI